MLYLVTEHDYSSFTIHGIFDMPPEHWEALNQQFDTLINHPGDQPKEPESVSIFDPEYSAKSVKYQADYADWRRLVVVWLEKMRVSDKARDELAMKLGLMTGSKSELFVAWLKATGIKEVEYVEV